MAFGLYWVCIRNKLRVPHGVPQVANLEMGCLGVGQAANGGQNQGGQAGTGHVQFLGPQNAGVAQAGQAQQAGIAPQNQK